MMMGRLHNNSWIVFDLRRVFGTRIIGETLPWKGIYRDGGSFESGGDT